MSMSTVMSFSNTRTGIVMTRIISTSMIFLMPVTSRTRILTCICLLPIRTRISPIFIIGIRIRDAHGLKTAYDLYERLPFARLLCAPTSPRFGCGFIFGLIAA
ncbi:hypothetical protein OKW34_002574 [Paraburkholderia youngii]